MWTASAVIIPGDIGAHATEREALVALAAAVARLTDALCAAVDALDIEAGLPDEGARAFWSNIFHADAPSLPSPDAVSHGYMHDAPIVEPHGVPGPELDVVIEGQGIRGH